MSERHFLVTDDSGRGIAVTLPLSDICERWDLSYSNDSDDEFAETFGDWLACADVGQKFVNHEDHCTFTRTE